MTARYKHDYAAFGELVLNADFMVAAMRARGEAVLAEAERTAPFDPETTDGTHYRDAFKLDAHTRGGIHGDRAEAVVSNDDAAAPYVEFGNGTAGTAHHTLERAIDVIR